MFGITLKSLAEYFNLMNLTHRPSPSKEEHEAIVKKQEARHTRSWKERSHNRSLQRSKKRAARLRRISSRFAPGTLTKQQQENVIAASSWATLGNGIYVSSSSREIAAHLGLTHSIVADFFATRQREAKAIR